MPFNILLVDDDSEYRDELKDCLYDYAVTEAPAGKHALGIFEKPNDVDLVVLDVMMPGMDGIEVLKKIKKMAPDIPVVMLTGHSSEDIAISALKAHADDYLEKPVDLNKFLNVIEELLESKTYGDDIGSWDNRAKTEKVKIFIERNWHKKIRLKDVSRIVCLSPKYLSRIFKEEQNIGFNEYILNVKIKKAKNLLKNTGYTVSQISDKLGYENIESFTRIFKSYTSKTPAEYRHYVPSRKPRKSKRRAKSTKKQVKK